MPKRDLPPSPNGKSKAEEGVAEPGVNDVISGRGDTINRHPGNVQFRKMVEEKRRVYLSSHFKREKRLIAETIVSTILAMDPPGRFLSRDPKTGLWFSIGWDRAREKASQALRENSKKIRAEIQQKDLQRQRENAAAAASSAPPAPPANGKPNHYDPHQYPFPPSGPGWGYPYYYGYGPHQVPAYPPPVFHPHAYPPHPPPMPLPPGPNGTSSFGYPDAVPYGARHQDQGRPHSKETPEEQDPLRRTESDEHMDSSGSSSDELPLPPVHEDRSEEQHLDSRPSLKCRRIEPLHHEPTEERRSILKDVQDESCSYSTFPSKPFYAHAPPTPCLNFTEHTPSKAHNKSPPRNNNNHNNRPSPIFPTGSTPDTMVHKLAHASPPSTYTIRSPHFGAPLLRSGPFHPHATLTPAGVHCVSALEDILASPETEEGSSMGYTRSSSMDSPLAVSPCKDSAVPFSPIQAHLDVKRHPHLKPRPFYR